MSVYEKRWRKELKDAMETSLGACLCAFESHQSMALICCGWQTADATGVSKSMVVRRRLPFTVTAVGTRKLAFRWGVEVVGPAVRSGDGREKENKKSERLKLSRLVHMRSAHFRRLR